MDGYGEDEYFGEGLSEDDKEFLSRYKSQSVGGAYPDVEELGFLIDEISGTPGHSTQAESAKKRLISMLVPIVPEIALEYAGKGMPLSDLVQEGNVAVMLALETLYAAPYADPYEILPYLRGEVRGAIEAALDIDLDEYDKGEKVAERLNKLSDQIKELSEALGYTPSIEELSIYLEMPAEEIDALVRLTGENPDDAGTAGEETPVPGSDA